MKGTFLGTGGAVLDGGEKWVCCWWRLGLWRVEKRAEDMFGINWNVESNWVFLIELALFERRTKVKDAIVEVFTVTVVWRG